MRNKGILAAAVVGIGSVAGGIYLEAKEPQTYGTLSAEYVRCYDGDTCTFNIPGVHPVIGDKISVRLEGIDTPEMKGKCVAEKKLAVEVRDYVRGILEKAKKIELVDIQRGKYFRLVARVVADGEIDLSVDLIERGYAVRYDGGTKIKDWCEE